MCKLNRTRRINWFIFSSDYRYIVLVKDCRFDVYCPVWAVLSIGAVSARYHSTIVGRFRAVSVEGGRKKKREKKREKKNMESHCSSPTLSVARAGRRNEATFRLDGSYVVSMQANSKHDVTYAVIHEIIFSTIDKPKLLSQDLMQWFASLSTLLSDIGLNIREAHVFSTIDGYSLDVFVVDGWSEEVSFHCEIHLSISNLFLMPRHIIDTDDLHKEIEAAINRNEV
ncbi:hypothetical protein BHM03_00041959 [Ensete ventricosum]|nr:hypothetical protein BHM03_00041959 [Ensete ventricosum]